MTKQEAKDLIGSRRGWLGIEEIGNQHEYSFYARRPLTTYAYRLDSEAERDKAAYWLSVYTTPAAKPEGGKEMKKITMKICPWEDGHGWQNHCIADRTANTIAELFDQLNQLQLDMDGGTDYSVDIRNGKAKIAEFWLSEFVKSGVVVDGIKYSV